MYFGEYIKTLKNVGVITISDPMYFEDEELSFNIPLTYDDYDCYIDYSYELGRPMSMAIVKKGYNGKNWNQRRRILEHSHDGENWKDCIVWVDLATVAFINARGGADYDTIPEEDKFECMSGYGDGAYPIYYWQDKHRDIVALQVKFIEDNLDLVHGTGTVPFEKVLEVFNR